MKLKKKRWMHVVLTLNLKYKLNQFTCNSIAPIYLSIKQQTVTHILNSVLIPKQEMITPSTNCWDINFKLKLFSWTFIIEKHVWWAHIVEELLKWRRLHRWVIHEQRGSVCFSLSFMSLITAAKRLLTLSKFMSEASRTAVQVNEFGITN